MRYWIMDKDQTPQRFPLQRLFRHVIKVTGTKAEVCSVLRARGYGLRVNELEQALDAVDMVTVPISELDELSASTEEWFRPPRKPLRARRRSRSVSGEMSERLASRRRMRQPMPAWTRLLRRV
jgi:hypothetical protein